jgi:hypothetical protein
MARLSPQSLQGLRMSLRPEYTDVPWEDLEQVVASSVEDMPPAVAEDFIKALSSLGKAWRPPCSAPLPRSYRAPRAEPRWRPVGRTDRRRRGLASSALGGAPGPRLPLHRPP